MPLWRMALVIAGAVAGLAAVMVLIGGVLLIAVPVALVAVLAYRLLGRPTKARKQTSVQTIEGEYVVMTDDDTRPFDARRELPRPHNLRD